MKENNLNSIFELKNPSKQFIPMSLSQAEQGELRQAVLDSFGPTIFSQLNDVVQALPDQSSWPAASTAAC